MKKTVTLTQAVAQIPDGASVMVGGFMGVGTPPRLIEKLFGKQEGPHHHRQRYGASGRRHRPADRRSARPQVLVSHIGTNPVTQRQMLAGEIEVELIPQGTLIERIRAGGYGLGGILTPTGLGTIVEDGKRTIEVDGRQFLLESRSRRNTLSSMRSRRIIWVISPMR